MTIGAIIQARMSSRRLPGKVLRPLAGRPALAWLVERLQHAADLDAVVIATSMDPSDDAIEAWCAEVGVRCHRGPLDDVAGRVLHAALAEHLDAFVRVNGDSPLLDQRLVDRGVALMRAARPDLVTNVAPRTYPPGQSVEVVRTCCLERAVAGGLDHEQREHVTLALYGLPGVSIRRFEADPPAPAGVRYVLDTEEDAARLDAILRDFDRPAWQVAWEDLPA